MMFDVVLKVARYQRVLPGVLILYGAAKLDIYVVTPPEKLFRFSLNMTSKPPPHKRFIDKRNHSNEPCRFIGLRNKTF